MQDFINALDSLRTRTARFRRLTIHLHSPDSHDWGKENSSGLNDKSLLTGVLGQKTYASHLEPHFDLVAVTDHMKASYACSLSKQMAKSKTGPIVLPGMEVNFRPESPLAIARIHVLVIFPEGSGTATFGGLFAGMDIPLEDADRNGKDDEVCGIHLKDWVAKVHQLGGICIAAHVDSKQGIRCRFRQVAKDTLRLLSEDSDESAMEKEGDIGDQLKEYLLGSGVDAIEVHKSGDATHYKWTSPDGSRTRIIPAFLTSDAHRVEDFNRPTRTTHVKMTSLGFHGLRSALDFPETRIRFPYNLPESPSPCILGVRIIGTENSLFENETVAFAENLNCVIGPRGSGKSTLVEVLRYVFGYNRTLDDLGQLKTAIRDLQVANLSGCRFQLAYRTASNETLVLEATYDPKEEYTTKVYAVDGEYRDIPDVEDSGDFPLRLFGWSEIELLGRRPHLQRELLDRLVPKLAPVRNERAQLRSEMETGRIKVMGIVAELFAIFEDQDGLIRKYAQSLDDFKRQDTVEVKSLFRALDLSNAKTAFLKQLAQNATSLRDAFDKADTDLLEHKVDKLLAAGGEEIRKWWQAEELKELSEGLVKDRVVEFKRKSIKSLDTFISSIDAHLEVQTKHSGTLHDELKANFEGDATTQNIAELRQFAKKRLERVQAQREKYLEKLRALDAVLLERQSTASELQNCQQRIAGIRAEHYKSLEDRLNRFLPSDLKVSIQFNAGRDCEAMLGPLKNIFKTRKGFATRTRSVAMSSSNPVELGQMLMDGDVTPLVTTDDVDEPFTAEHADDCVEFAKPFENDEGACVRKPTDKGVMLGKILGMQEAEWDDYVAILLNDGPVSEKSPGQRSSAMLPLIALSQTSPLVIDQPEDNLDKRLIGKVLTNILAELKEKRQIIVCTHDPNVLVGGDAEQVIVLSAESDSRAKVESHGSIDNQDIVATVVDILEGGAEAFSNRRKRYGVQVEDK